MHERVRSALMHGVHDEHGEHGVRVSQQLRACSRFSRAWQEVSVYRDDFGMSAVPINLGLSVRPHTRRSPLRRTATRRRAWITSTPPTLSRSCCVTTPSSRHAPLLVCVAMLLLSANLAASMLKCRCGSQTLAAPSHNHRYPRSGMFDNVARATCASSLWAGYHFVVAGWASRPQSLAIIRVASGLHWQPQGQQRLLRMDRHAQVWPAQSS